jgi:signal transduction histidine kinase
MQPDSEPTNALEWLCGQAPPVRVLLIQPGHLTGPDIRALLEQQTRTPCVVKTAYAVQEALDGRHQDCQVVLLDAALSGDDAGNINLIRETTELPVITINGADEVRNICLAAAAGALDYLPRDAINADLLVRSIHYAAKLDQMAASSREFKRMQEDFVAHISHELRTPLNSILGFTQLLLEGNVPEPETQTEFLDIVQTQGQLLSRLIDNLLDASLLNPEIYRTAKAPCRPEDILRQALDVAREAAVVKGVTIRSEITGTLPEMQADAARLSQAVGNLLHNAVRFSDAGSEVWLRAGTDGRQITLSVADQGIGIAADVLPFLFDRFYAAGDRDHQAGAGMGLYLTRAIVDAHEGNIWVESVPGKGSTFFITLPLDPAS